MFFSKKPETPASPDALPAGAAGPSTPNDAESMKKALIQQILIESNTNNARVLIDNVNENCFNSCISKPGTSISSSEQTCATQCFEKYIQAWNQVHATYMKRIQQEVAKQKQ